MLQAEQHTVITLQLTKTEKVTSGAAHSNHIQLTKTKKVS